MLDRMLRALHRWVGPVTLRVSGVLFLLNMLFWAVMYQAMSGALELFIICALLVVACVFFAASGKEYGAPPLPPPFFRSTDKDGRFIMTNGVKEVTIGEDGQLRSTAPLTWEEMMEIRLACDELIFSELAEGRDPTEEE